MDIINDEPILEDNEVDDKVLKELYSLAYPPPISVENVSTRDVQDIPGIIKRDPYAPMGSKSNRDGTWVKQFLAYKNFGQFLVDIYDNWLEVRLPEQLANITIDLPDNGSIKYLDVHIESPRLKTSQNIGKCNYTDDKITSGTKFLPSMAKEFISTYAVSVYARPYLTYPNGREIPLSTNVCHIGDIPLMLRSKFCHLHSLSNKELLDIGEDPDTSRGYFIVEGKKKIIINFEKVRLNKPLLYRYSAGDVICRTTFESHNGTSIVELSFEDKNNKSRKINIYLSSLNYYDNKKIKGSKKMDIKDKRLNVFHVFNFLTNTVDENGNPINMSYQQILDNYVLPFVKPEHKSKVIAELAFTLVDMNAQTDDPVEFFMEKMGAPDRDSTEEEVRRILTRDLFPTLNDLTGQEKYEYKLLNLGFMVARISEYMAGVRELDNRDLWANKRLESAGRMMEQFFRIMWGHLLKKALEAEMKVRYAPLIDKYKSELPSLDKAQPTWLLSKLPQFANNIDYRQLATNLTSHVKYENVTELFKNAFSKAWQIRGVYRKDNVVQELKTDNKTAALSHLLRIDIESSHQGTVQDIRHMQPDQYGFICAVQTPEGGPCGLVKNLGVTTQISVGMTKTLEIAFIEELTALRYNEYGEWILNVDPDFGEYRTVDDEDIGPDVFIKNRGGRLDGRFFLNGRFLGWCNANSLYNKIYSMKVNKSALGSTQMILSPEVSVTKDNDNNINVFTDNSRVIRPLFLVNDEGTDLVYNQLRMNPPDVIKERMMNMYPDLTLDEITEKGLAYNYNFNDLLTMGAATYVDPEEQTYIKLASFQKNIAEYFSEIEAARLDYNRTVQEYDTAKNKNTKSKKDMKILELERDRAKNKLDRLASPKHRRYTHCELHPQAILGVSASIIPMPQTDQAARATFQSGMGTQALSTYHPNHRNIFDGKTKLLAFPSNPVLSTEMENITGIDNTPQGQNVILAFSSHLGMTGEDAFIFSQRAIDLGKFRVIKFIPFTAIINTRGKLDQLRRPHDNEFANDKDKDFYHAIGDNGLPRINSELKSGDVVISSFRTDVETLRPINTSITMGSLEDGIVDSVHVSEKTDGNLIVRVVLRKVRKPRTGDKFAARNAQKGTISIILPTEDMPFTERGMIPDVIVNPHSIPGRMTMEYMIELLTGKVGAITGERINGTPYEKVDLDKFFELLRELGYNEAGTEVMYNGVSGRKMKVPIFIGPAFFQALRHQIDDKYQARGKKGGIKAVTHQPTEGRSKGGGIRFGNHFAKEWHGNVFASPRYGGQHNLYAGRSRFVRCT